MVDERQHQFFKRTACGRRSTRRGEKTYIVVGYICETDTFGSDRSLNEVREGDLLAFKNAGAYGFEMSSNFNSRLKPAEVMVKDGKAHLIRRRDVFEDLLRNQVEIPDEVPAAKQEAPPVRSRGAAVQEKQ